MGIACNEQETHICFMRDSDICRIYTTDSTMITRLDKLAEDEGSPDWKLVKEHNFPNGEPAGKTYETKKRLITFRSGIREMSEEQKQAAAERIRKWRAEKYGSTGSV